MNEVDNRIVRLEFDNSNFEKNAEVSIKTLDKLKKGLDLEESADNLKAIEDAAKRISFDGVANSLDGIGKSVDDISNRFTLMGIIGQKVMGQIADGIINATKSAAAFFTTSNLSGGFDKYSTSTKATQTILSAIKDTAKYAGDSKKALSDIDLVLGKLQKYTDETSYSFTEMTTTIGKFTAAGIDVVDAEEAMEGIANAAAKAGVGIQGANMAMAQISQGMSKGYFQVIDWQSLENYNIATADFKQTMIEAGLALGTLKQAANGKIFSGKDEVTVENLRTTLKNKWLTSEVFMEAMGKYADRTTQFGREAFEAAQKALTFNDAIQAIRDSMTTGWMNSFKIVFGDLEESITLWTDFCNAIIEVTAGIDEWRNSALQAWKDGGGRDTGMQGLVDTGSALINILYGIREGFINAFEGGFDIEGNIPFDNMTARLLGVSDALATIGGRLKSFFSYTPNAETQALIDMYEGHHGTFSNSELYRDRFVLTQFAFSDENGNIIDAEEAYSRMASYRDIIIGLSKQLKNVDADSKAGEQIKTQLDYYTSLMKSIKKIEKESEGGDIEDIPFLGQLIKGNRDPKNLKDTASSVAELQMWLNELDETGTKLTVDGIFGSKTDAALKSFQKSAGLAATGIYDKDTHEAIIRELTKGPTEYETISQAFMFDKSSPLQNITQVTEFLSGIGVLVTDGLTASLAALGEILDTLSPIAAFGMSIVGFVSSIGSALISCVSDLQIFDLLLDSVKMVLAPIHAVFNSTFGVGAQILTDFGQGIHDNVIGGFRILLSILTDISSIAGGLLGSALSALFAPVTKFSAAVTKVTNAVKEGEDVKNPEWIKTLKENMEAAGEDTGLLDYIQKVIDLYTKLSDIKAPNIGEWLNKLFGTGGDNGGIDFTMILGSIGQFGPAMTTLMKRLRVLKNDEGLIPGEDKYISSLIDGNPEFAKAYSTLSNLYFNVLKPMFDGVGKFSTSVFNSLLSAIGKLPSILGKVGGFFTGIYSKVKKNVSSGKGSNDGGILSSIFGNVESFFSDNGGFFGTLTAVWEKFTGWLSEIWGTIEGSSIWESVSTSLANAFSWLLGVISRIGQTVGGAFTTVWNWLFPSAAADTEDGAVDAISGAAEKLEEAQSTFDRVMTWFRTNIGNPIKEFLAKIFPTKDEAAEMAAGMDGIELPNVSIWNEFLENVKNIWNNVKSFFSGEGGTEGSYDLGKGIHDFFSNFWNSILYIFTGDGEGNLKPESELSDFEKNLRSTVEWLQGVWDGFVEGIKSVFGFGSGSDSESGGSGGLAGTIDGIVDFVKSKWQEFVSLLSNIFGVSEDGTEAESEAEAKAYTVGSIVDSIIKVLGNAWTKIRAFFAGIFGVELAPSVDENGNPITESVNSILTDSNNALTFGQRLDGVISKIRNLFEKIKYKIRLMFEGLFGADDTGTVMVPNGAGAKPVLTGSAHLQETYAAASETKTLGERIQEVVDSIIEIKDKIVNKIQSIGEFFTNIFTIIFGGTASAEEGSAGASEREAAIEALGEKAESVVKIGEYIGNVSEAFNSIFKADKNTNTSVWERIENFLGVVFSPLASLFGVSNDVVATLDTAKDPGNADKKSTNIFQFIGNIFKSVGKFILGAGASIFKMIPKLFGFVMGLMIIYTIVRGTMLYYDALSSLASIVAVPFEVARWTGIIASILALSYLVKVVSALEPGKVWEVIGVLTAYMLLVVAMGYFVDKASSSGLLGNLNGLKSLAAVLISMSVSLIAIAYATKVFGTMSDEELKRGLIGIAASIGVVFTFIVALSLAMKIASKTDLFRVNLKEFGDALIKIGGGIIAITVGVIAIAGAMWLLSKIDANAMINGGLKMVAILGVVLVMSKVIGNINKLNGDSLGFGLSRIGFLLISMGAGLIAITASMLILSRMDNDAFLAGIWKVGVILLALAGFIRLVSTNNFVIPKVSNFLGGIAMFVGLSLLIVAMAGALYIVKDINPVAIIAMGLVIVGLVFAMKSIMTAASSLGTVTNLTAALTLVGVALVIGAIAGSLVALQFFKVDVGYIITLVGAISVVMLAIAVMLRSLSMVHGSLGSTISTVMQLIPIIVIIGGVLFAAWKLTSIGVDLDSVTRFLGGVTAVVASLAGVLFGMAVLAPASAAVIPVAGSLIVVILAIVGIFSLIASVDVFRNGFLNMLRMFAVGIGYFYEEVLYGQMRGLAKGLKAFGNEGIDASDIAPLVESISSLIELYNTIGQNKSTFAMAVEWFSGKTQFDRFSEGIANFATAMSELSDKIGGITTNVTSKKVADMVDAIKPIRDLYEELSNFKTGGSFAVWTGTTGWDHFINTLGKFGASIVALNNELGPMSEETGKNLLAKVKPVVETLDGIADLALRFVTVDGKAVSLGGTVTSTSGFFTNTVSNTEEGWIGFITSLSRFGNQITNMNRIMGEVSESDAKALGNKIKNITPALSAIADIYETVGRVEPLQEGEAYAINMLASRLPEDVSDNGLFGTNWGMFIEGVPKVIDAVTTAGIQIEEALSGKKINGSELKTKYLDPITSAASNIALIYQNLSSVKLDKDTDLVTGQTIFTNTAFMDFVSALVGEGDNLGFADQMVRYANTLFGVYYDLEGNMLTKDNALTKPVGKTSFADLSNRVVTAATGIANIYIALANAQAELEDSGVGGAIPMFGENGLANQFVELLGGNEGINSDDITTFGEAARNYAAIIQEIDGTEFVKDSTDVVTAITGVAKFLSAISVGTEDANGESYKLDSESFSNGSWQKFWGTEGVLYKFTEFMSTDWGDGVKTFPEMLKTFYATITAMFDSNGNYTPEEFQEGISNSIASLTSIASFVRSISSDGDIALTNESIDMFENFMTTLSSMNAITGNTTSFKDVIENLVGASGLFGEVDDSGVSTAETKMQSVVRVLRSFAAFISDVARGFYVMPVSLGFGDEGPFSMYLNSVSDIKLLLDELASIDDTNGNLASIGNILAFLTNGINTETWAENFNTEAVVSAIQAFNDSVTGTLNSSALSLQEATANYSQAGASLAESMAGSISSDAANSSIQSMASSASSAGSDSETTGKFVDVGSGWAGAIARGLSENARKAIDAGKDLAKRVIDTINNEFGVASPSKVFEKIGMWCDAGLAKGIKGSSFMSEKASAYAAKKSIESAEDEVEVASPSRVFATLGENIDQAMASGISGSASDVRSSAGSMISEALSAISNFIDSDIDSQPTIRPVMDLSEMARSASALNGMIPNSASIGLTSSTLANRANAIGGFNQNGNGSANTYNNQSYGGLSFAGATFNVRSEQDVQALANEISALNTANLQAHGVLST